ncbi:hypothetical protein RHSIM_Rhsim06G0126300 [Rhododendron simsii]|uniref:Uncharacterized protein n=1 Tax=Rhododendron simsii TaxID=118357 RepID=A0A834GVP3_RHOSS|nr:hypothetical protein RHSIM_Rhsim06G0126300 [Rhododendron simsii]
MKEYGVSTSWSKLFRIDLQGLTRPLGLRKNGEAIFMTDDGDLVSCNYQSGRITYLGIRGTFGGWYSHWQAFYTDTYTESLELLNKLVSPENTVVSGQMKSNTKEDEEDEKQKGVEIKKGFQNYLFKELGQTMMVMVMMPPWCLLLCGGGTSTMETTEVVREKNEEKGEGNGGGVLGGFQKWSGGEWRGGMVFRVGGFQKWEMGFISGFQKTE